MPERSITRVLEHRKPVIVEHDEWVIDVVKAMKDNAEDAALVIKEGKTYGLVTETDLIRRVILGKRDPDNTTIGAVATTQTVILGPHCNFGHALYLMHEYGIRHVPVIEKGKPLGVVSIADLLIGDISQYEHDAEMLDHIAEVL